MRIRNKITGEVFEYLALLFLEQLTKSTIIIHRQQFHHQ